jgi:HSP20 family protein
MKAGGDRLARAASKQGLWLEVAMARQDVFGWGRYDPFEEMRRLQDEVNRVFSSSAAGARALGPAEFPAINAFANEDGIAITAELPGVKADDLDISVVQGGLTLRGRREVPEEAKAYHRRERQQGEFVRTINLPFAVDPNRVEASLENGVLRLSLHRPEEEKPRRIKISAA